MMYSRIALIAVAISAGACHAEESPQADLPALFEKLVQRFKDLAAFSKRAGLKEEQSFYEKSLAVLENAK